MKKRTAFFSILALVFQVAQGLLLHPYQTMQSLVREKLFIWLSFLPSFVLVSLVGLSRLVDASGLVSLSGLVGSSDLIDSHNLVSSGGVWFFGGWMQTIVGFRFFMWWIFFFCLYWQLLLLYLLLRFWFGFKKASN